jgi:NADPH-ferrihemoprotein reductase
MATHYEGDPTDNAVKFFNWLKDEARDNRDLSTLRFSVFGLGNTQYEHYNAIGRKTNAFLEKLGGNRYLYIYIFCPY